MKILACVEIPELYTAVSHVLEKKRNRYVEDREYCETLYHCLKCGTDFHIHHRFKPGCYYYGVDDDYVRCPVCGHAHQNHNLKQDIVVCDDTWSPVNAYIKVVELKNEVLLKVSSEVWNVKEDLDLQTILYEEFRFNVKKRKTTFRRWLGKGHSNEQEFELGKPFSSTIYNSVLAHVHRYNGAKQYKQELMNVLKILRDTVRTKWKKLHGYKLKGGYVSHGQQNGYMCFPLLNLAYRLVCPDSNDLPVWLNGSATERARESDRRYYKSELVTGGVFNDLDALRKADNYLDPIIEYYNLPNTQTIRRLLTDDVFLAATLGRIYEVIPNQNHALAVYSDLQELASDWEGGYAYTTMRELTDNVLAVSQGRSGSEIRGFIRYVRKKGSGHLKDITYMFSTVPKEVQEKALKVKMKDLHDWLVNEKKKIEEAGYSLEVPEHVVKRLQMQMDMVKFYLPNHSNELKHGSDVFHNCVRTYSRRVLEKQCQIVYMTDDNGKLTACLEIRGNELVQAKLKYNRPVSGDSAVNGAVVDWCRKVGLRIKTYDVREMRYPMALEVSA